MCDREDWPAGHLQILTLCQKQRDLALEIVRAHAPTCAYCKPDRRLATSFDDATSFHDDVLYACDKHRKRLADPTDLGSAAAVRELVRTGLLT